MPSTKSEKCKEMIRLSQEKDLAQFAKALKACPAAEVDAVFCLKRPGAGFDGSTVTRHLSALGYIFYVGGSSDFAALLIEKGATITPKMAKDLLNAIYSQCYTSSGKAKNLNQNLEALVSFVSHSGVDWNKVKISNFFLQEKAFGFLEQLVGRKRAISLGLPADEADDDDPVVTIGAPTKRLLKKQKMK